MSRIGDRDATAAIQQLQAFINQVEALRGTMLTDAEADELVAAAQALIQAMASCT